MDNLKNSEYYTNKIINDIIYVIHKTEILSYEQLCNDETLCDSICFRFIQISENASKLKEFNDERYKKLPYSQMTGLRNRIVHDYGGVDFNILFRTIKEDLPSLLKLLKEE